MCICILLLFTWWAPVCFVRAQTDRCRPQHLSPLLLFLALQSFQTDLDDYTSSLSRPTRSLSAAWVSLAKSSTMMSWIGRYLTPALRSNRLSLLLIQLHLLVVEPQARPRIAVCLAPKHLWWFSFWPALLQQLRFWKNFVFSGFNPLNTNFFQNYNIVEGFETKQGRLCTQI